MDCILNIGLNIRLFMLIILAFLVLIHPGCKDNSIIAEYFPISAEVEYEIILLVDTGCLSVVVLLSETNHTIVSCTNFSNQEVKHHDHCKYYINKPCNPNEPDCGHASTWINIFHFDPSLVLWRLQISNRYSERRNKQGR